MKHVFIRADQPEQLVTDLEVSDVYDGSLKPSKRRYMTIAFAIADQDKPVLLKLSRSQAADLTGQLQYLAGLIDMEKKR